MWLLTLKGMHAVTACVFKIKCDLMLVVVTIIFISTSTYVIGYSVLHHRLL